MISEIRIVTQSVSDLQRSVSFYKEALSYVEVGQGSVMGPDIERTWRIPQGMKGQYAVMASPGINSGMVRLVQFDKPGERIWGDYSSKQDLGHYAVNYRTEDINALWPKLLKAGATAKSAPEFWQVNEELAAWDSMCFDPDGVILNIFKVEGTATERMGTVTNDVSEVQTMAIHVADARRSQAFYQGLGYEVLYDKVVENMEEFFGVPKGTNLHNINLFKPATSPNGRIEIAQYVGFLGKELRDKAAPPNIGILSISFETDELDNTVKLVHGLSGQAIGGPVQLELAPFGEMRLATFFGPDGEAVEFFERL